MKSCQLPISLSKAISPTTMITILPVGWLLYAGGSLPVETFITTIVLSLASPDRCSPPWTLWIVWLR